MHDPSVPPLSICPVCEIPIIQGTDHSSMIGCFDALKAFVKLCQDDIESTRMRDFQHPTREELIQALREMEEQFKKLVVYENALIEHVADLLRGKL